MCGIAGIFHSDRSPVQKENIAAMSRALHHRGPDDEGSYFSTSGDVGFGFRRLSIIDVSDGHQPMSFNDQTIVFNGEIYNYRELRAECEAAGVRFKTHSDTEVLLHLWDRFGPGCLPKLNGMFSFAVWDERKRELFAARDRLGIKPLYYFHSANRFAFASEVKSLIASKEVPREFDPAGLFDFCSFRFVPAPFTVLKDVRKVRPGHWLSVKDGKLAETSYWSLQNARSQKIDRLEEHLTSLLEDSVRLQMISDVPLGAFLSGGVDSSLITALMVKHSKQRVKTFSIGFEKGTGVDESAYARKVARALGTEHHELIVRESDLQFSQDVFSRMNEPVADPTVLPTALLSRFARREVKVALTGEGGDELFAGYNRYKALLYSQWIQGLPAWLQRPASALFRRVGKGRTFRNIPNLGPGNWFDFNRDFPAVSVMNLFRRDLISGESYLLERAPQAAPGLDLLNRVLDLERQTSLVDRLLMKVDMASMGCSLEARPPFLDHRLVELAFSIPAGEKIKRFKGKHILRRIAEPFLPRDICWRRKHGFIIPITQWAGRDSREKIEALLSDANVEKLGVFDPAAIQLRRQKIYNGRDGDSMALLWPVIVLAAWTQSLSES